METQTTSEASKKTNGTAAASAAKVLTNTDMGWEAPLNTLRIQKGFNVRKDTDPNPELVASVKEHGVRVPIQIRDNQEEPGTFVVVDGERRLKAAKKAKLSTVPVVYQGNMDDAAATVLSLTTNENQKTLTPAERAEGFRRLKEFVDEDEIARLMGTSTRTVKETLRALEKGVAEIKEGVKKPVEKGGIPTRVAARAADLPPKIQKKVAQKVKGKSTKEGLKVVQKAEKEIGKVQRGRKPTLGLAKDAKRRVDMLEMVILDRLKKDPRNTRMLAHLEIVWIMRGDRDVKDIYLAAGGMTKLATTAEAMKKAKAQDAPKKAAAKATAKKASAKKGGSKKAKAAKKPAKKGARKGAR